MKAHWPQDRDDPFGIKNDFNWNEIGAIFRIVGENNVRLVIETGVGRGDLAAWMISKTMFDPSFSYLGITNDPAAVDKKVIDSVILSGTSFVAVGAPCSKPMVDRVSKLIRNSSAALVLCDGLDIEREVDHYLPSLRTGDVIVAHHFLEVYKAKKLMDMARNDRLIRITGDWMTKTRLVAGVLT